MATPPDYSKLVEQAEKAVAAVKDPELKGIAFQKVLDDLLQSPTPAGRPGKPEKGKRVAPREAKSKRSRRRAGPAAYLQELVDEGFFKKPKTITQVKGELENRGHHIPLTSLSGRMQSLCQSRTLRRQKSKAAGKKAVFIYSNW